MPSSTEIVDKVTLQYLFGVILCPVLHFANRSSTECALALLSSFRHLPTRNVAACAGTVPICVRSAVQHAPTGGLENRGRHKWSFRQLYSILFNAAAKRNLRFHCCIMFSTVLEFCCK